MATGQEESDDDVALFAPVEGWTVVLWPEYFNAHDVQACEALSAALATLASTVHTYDGDYWVDTIFRDGQRLDRFASMPDYFAEDAAEVAILRERWAGNPDTVAAAFGTPVEQVAPYYVHESSSEAGAPVGKGFADDEFELTDMWVFADLWRRLGISYPEDPGTAAVRLRIADGWTDRLPTHDDDL